MTLRQTILKYLYPLFTWFKKNSDTKLLQNDGAGPLVPFYSLSTQLNNGKTLSFEMLKGKKVMIVNTASDCGYTNQYAELQKLYDHEKENLEIIAFPANDFKEQEKGTDEEIAKFCAINYSIRFALAKKAVVVKNNQQDPVFQWLTQKEKNGWNDQQPSWNFSKYLINEEGILTHYFDPAISPLSAEVVTAIKERKQR
jgi:glutathione peroxidase